MQENERIEISKEEEKNIFEEFEENKEIEEQKVKENNLKKQTALEDLKTEEKELKEETKTIELKLLEDKKSNAVFIGRSKAVFEKYGDDAALFIGKIKEENFEEKAVLLDSLNPHVIFVCGARGSGKSYCLGVIAEEIAKKNPNVAAVVIDPIGVFWSMRYPNKEKKEIEKLIKWQLKPEGLENIVVFIPKGLEKETPKETFDATFTIKPSLLTPQDWALTFGIDRFSPTGLLLDKVLTKVKTGFKDLQGQIHKGKNQDYSIDDIIFCLENDAEINSKERGFKADSIRALSSRFEGAKNWGIFDVKGTPLVEICREGRLTVIDTSFLDDNVTALVVGIIARRILAARKLSTRKEAVERLEIDTQKMLETDIPPTWLFIDEAHTLMPAGNISTAASNALIEYVKQGRRPGCSLVFATQQPSAIDSKVLSQLDIILIHKLVFNDDIKAVFKRTPTILPNKFKAANFIKMLPVGITIVGDRREETSRAFIMEIRPRMSQHEGREAEAVEIKKELSSEQLLSIALTMIWFKLEREKKLSFETIEKELNDLNKKYSSNAKFEKLLAKLEAKGALIDEEQKIVILKELEEKIEIKPEIEEPIKISESKIPESKEIEEKISLVCLKPKYNKKNALSLLNNFRKKKFLGLFGSQEILDSFELKAALAYKVDFNYFDEENSFRQGSLYINSMTGELMHYVKGKIVESSGLKYLYDLNEEQLKIINALRKEALTKKQLMHVAMTNEAKILRIVEELKEKGLVKVIEENNEKKVILIKEFDLPLEPLHPLLRSLELMPKQEEEMLSIVKPKFEKKDVIELLKKLWKKIVIVKVNEIYLPVIEATFKEYNGSTRKILIDAIEGKTLEN